MRVARAGYHTLDAMDATVPRQRVLDLCEMLDAIEEAEELARLRAEERAKRR